MNAPLARQTAGNPVDTQGLQSPQEDALSLSDLVRAIRDNKRNLLIVPAAIGAMTLAITFLIPPTFTAKTSFLPPQQQQSASAAALASLGALSGLAGAAGAIKTPGDQYIGLMQSANASDSIIDKFKLMEVYESKFRFQARKHLLENTRISLGKKDGIITVEVDDHDPKRAADLANQYIEELRRLTSTFALTEAQQRRVFFEGQLSRTKEKLDAAQHALESSGFSPSAIKAEPKTAAEAYGKVKAETSAAEVKLQTLLRARAEGAPEVLQQRALLTALQGQLSRMERKSDPDKDLDYISRYREYKYQETLFELFSRQYESARLDESKEGAVLQVIDVASPPEVKSKPRRLLLAAAAGAISFLLLLITLVLRKKT